MRIDHQVVVFDAADLAAESSFWAEVLDGEVDAEDDWHMVIVDGEPRVGVQLAPGHLPPGLTRRDTAPTDPPRPMGRGLPSAHDRVMALGATVLKPAEQVTSPDNFQVYADPAGHPFCLCWIEQ